MVTPHDVKLGNVFIDVATNDYVTVQGIDEDNIRTEIYNQEGLREVALTATILSMCGFKQMAHNIHNERFLLNREGAYPIVLFVDHYNKVYFNSHFEIKTLHHLQNLFFDLTGLELTVQPHELTALE